MIFLGHGDEMSTEAMIDVAHGLEGLVYVVDTAINAALPPLAMIPTPSDSGCEEWDSDPAPDSDDDPEDEANGQP